MHTQIIFFSIRPGTKLDPNFWEKSLLPQLKIGRSGENLGRSLPACNSNYNYDRSQEPVILQQFIFKCIDKTIELILFCVIK